jgi:hypothetical protein
MITDSTTAIALPAHSRVWVYQAGRTLSDQEGSELTKLGKAFVSQWSSHGNSLRADFIVQYHRFAVLIVDELQTGASGCSIDTSVHFMQEMEERFGTSFFDRMTLCYFDSEVLSDCLMTEIPSLVKEGHLTRETLIFDNTIQAKSELESKWLVKMEDAWTNRYF